LIPVFLPKLPSRFEVAELLSISEEQRHYSNWGPLARQYEKELAEYLAVDSERVVILANATLCLHGLVNCINRDRWVVPDFTFAASGMAVLGAGKELHLWDVECKNWMLSFDVISRAVSLGYGVLPVLPFGKDVSESKILGLPGVLIDAAASLGHSKNDLENLNPQSAVVFSLHATKVLASGEGGVAVCGSVELARELRRWSWFGFDDDRNSVGIGTNAKMSEFSAAVGLLSLRNRSIELAEWAEKKVRVYEFCKKHGLSNFTQEFSGSPYWIVEAKSVQVAENITNHLNARDIQTRRWWPSPLSKMPAFRSLAIYTENPVAEDLAGRVLGLPFFRDISESDLNTVFVEMMEALE
jgi:dTDP-4-amino-4,6-dideoxygalactose transaminase